MALSGLLLWWKFNSAWYAFALAIVVDGIGVLPVLKARGEGENTTGWILFFLGSLANLVAVAWIEDKSLRIGNPNLADVAYPILATTIIVLPFIAVLNAYFKNSRANIFSPPPSTG